MGCLITITKNEPIRSQSKNMLLRAGSHGSQVSSPIHVSKSQHGGEDPTFEAKGTVKVWSIIIEDISLIILCKNICGICVEGWVHLFAQPNSQQRSQATLPQSAAM
jgi:hypothetical protein